MARYRLKYCLKGPLSPKQPTNHPTEQMDLILCFRGIRNIIKTLLQDNLYIHKGIKWNLILKVEMVKKSGDGRLQYNMAFFRSSMSILLWKGHIAHELNQAFQKLYNSFEEYNNKGSGWRIHRIYQMEVTVAAYKPLSGSSYIPLPKKLGACCSGIVNIKIMTISALGGVFLPAYIVLRGIQTDYLLI